MSHRIAHVTFLVRDYDEAIAWFTSVLGFRVLEDSALDGGKRWVLVGPPDGRGTSLLLARAATPQQLVRIGDQTGGRVSLFLHTEDLWQDHARMRSRGVRFTEAPRDESYGTVAVFEDLYGNRWDLVQPRELSAGEHAGLDNVNGPVAALVPLLGTWRGQGKAGFPTIAAFEYREQLRFQLDEERPLIHYEQRALHRPQGTQEWLPSHWESGFLRPVEPGVIEMTNAQDSGRLEILRFELTVTRQGVRLAGPSTQLINDPRMVSAHREIEVAGDELTYTVCMSTTRVPERHPHLRARLIRAHRAPA